jgi:hypothetical protein
MMPAAVSVYGLDVFKSNPVCVAKGSVNMKTLNNILKDVEKYVVTSRMREIQTDIKTDNKKRLQKKFVSYRSKFDKTGKYFLILCVDKHNILPDMNNSTEKVTEFEHNAKELTFTKVKNDFKNIRKEFLDRNGDFRLQEYARAVAKIYTGKLYNLIQQTGCNTGYGNDDYTYSHMLESHIEITENFLKKYIDKHDTEYGRQFAIRNIFMKTDLDVDCIEKIMKMKV